MTSRIALLALVLVMLLVSYAYPLRSWYDQRAERNELESEAEHLRQSVADLEAELEMWEDPAYVAAQARDRLGFVMPGEDGYIVIPPEKPAETADQDGDDNVSVSGQGTWYERLWGSVKAADAPVPGNDSRR